MSARPTLPPVARMFRHGTLPSAPGSKANRIPASQEAGYTTRRARAVDADAVDALIAHYAAQGLLLPRSEEDVRANIDHFLVLSLAGRVVGCVALEPYSADLAEIRSLAVAPEHAGNGRGARLVRFALAVAKRRRVARVFAVTHAPQFFERLGFTAARRQSIAEKVERDCRTCPKRSSCELVAVVCNMLPARVALPVVANAFPTLTAE